MHIKNRLKNLRPCLALAAASALAACGGGGGGGSPGPTPAPIVSLSHTTLSFGAQPSGLQSAAQVVNVSNIGSATLTVSSVTLTGTNASSFADTTTCAGVAAGASCSISVTFTPAGAGDDSATLNVNSDASGSPATVALSGTGQASGANTVATLIDAGPLPATNPTINILYTTVTVCAPGTQTCQVIDHVQVDTGSSGLRLLSSVLTPTLAAALTPVRTPSMAAGHALIECTQFADGYSWGPVKTVDLKIGTETASGIEVQVIGDPAYPASLAPTACTKGPNSTEENSVAAFGANGLIGMGFFIQDCGAGCTSDGSAYNDCTATACTGYAALLTEQLPNPVSQFATDNNGVVIQLPTLPEAQNTAVNGVIVFGVGATAGSLPGNVTVFQLNPGNATFTAHYNNTDLSSSFIDAGSNGWYFPNQAPMLATCPSPNTTFYCPTPNGSAMLSTTIHDFFASTVLATVNFTVYDFSQLTNSTVAASGLAGLSSTSLPNSFDFGLPFFFGKSVYVGFEGSTLGGQTGPAFAY
jgi:hypothetical protein